MTTTTTAARCVGESSRRSYYGGTQRLGRCARAVGFAVMGRGRHGGPATPELTCQQHLGGLVARMLASPRTTGPGAPSIAVFAVDPAGRCTRCGQRPDWHEPADRCPVAP